MSSKRNHHLQPNYYLKGFLSNPNETNPKIWVYEKGKEFDDSKNEKLQNPKHLTTTKAARKRDFYAFEKEDGLRDYEKYENLLQSDFEEPAKPVIEKIRQFDKNFKEINESEKKLLFKYIASMVTRGDWWKYVSEKIEEIVEPETKARIEIASLEIAKIAEEIGDERFSDSSKLRAFFQKNVSEEIEKRKKGEYEKSSMIKYAERFANELLPDLHVQFLTAPPQLPFLTSDNPVCYTGFQHVDVRLYFPISSRICLFANRTNKEGFDKWKAKEKGLWEIDDKTVELIRGFVVDKAIKEVYFSKKAAWLVKFVNNRIENHEK